MVKAILSFRSLSTVLMTCLIFSPEIYLCAKVSTAVPTVVAATCAGIESGLAKFKIPFKAAGNSTESSPKYSCKWEAISDLLCKAGKVSINLNNCTRKPGLLIAQSSNLSSQRI